MNNFIIIFICLIISGLADSQMDILKFQPSLSWFKSDWWQGKGKYSWDKRTWWTKNIFSMVSDGWHFLKFIRIFLICFALSYLLSGSFVWIVIQAIILYIIIGIIFEVGYNLLKKSN